MDSETKIMFAMYKIGQAAKASEIAEKCELAVPTVRQQLAKMYRGAGGHKITYLTGSNGKRWALRPAIQTKMNQIAQLRPHQLDIYNALRAKRHHRALFKDIARELGLSTNGVSQSLGAMSTRNLVRHIGAGWYEAP